jgi:hypothetical protein
MYVCVSVCLCERDWVVSGDAYVCMMCVCVYVCGAHRERKPVTARGAWLSGCVRNIRKSKEAVSDAQGQLRSNNIIVVRI